MRLGLRSPLDGPFNRAPFWAAGASRVTYLAPTFVITSGTDPDVECTVELDSAIEAVFAAGDTLTFAWTGTTSGSHVHTVTSGDVSALPSPIAFAIPTFSPGTYSVTVQYDGPTGNSPQSNAEALTVVAAFHPDDVFGAGDVGFMFDFTDVSRMTIGTDGTGGAPAANLDNVGRVTSTADGVTRHISATTDAKRPKLYNSGGVLGLTFDGSDDCLVGNSWNFSGGGATGTLMAAFLDNNSGTSAYMICEANTNYNSNANAIAHFMSSGTAGNVVWGARGGATAASISTTSGKTRPAASVTHCEFLMSGASHAAMFVNEEVDGAAATTSSAGTATAGSHFGTHVWYFGARGNSTLFANARLYAIFFIDRALTSQEKSDVETWMAAKAGVTLS